MFPPSVEAVSVMVTRAEPWGWSLRIATRLESERWTDVEWRQYDRLTMAEVLDVIDSSASRIGSMIS